MKKLFLAFLLSCLGAGAAQAATISGTVISAATCAPAASQKVYLRDSFFNTIDSTVTNSSGYYSMNFPTSWPTPKAFLITIIACSNTWNTTEHYHGNSITINPIICGAAKTLNGTVMLGSTPNTGPARVYLISVRRNFPTAGDTTLTAVDSVTLTNSPNFTFRRACAPSDTFLIKAALLPAHASYSSWLPSYDSSLNWSTATRYYGSAFNGMPHYLYMYGGTNPGGPGFIGGSVLAGANKQTAVGDPLPARLMMLVNTATNKPVAYTYTDALGKFSFSNIAAGTYKLFGDSWGLNNIPLTVTITAAKPTVNNIIFEEHYIENSFKGKFNTSGVGTLTGPLAGVSAYPNPATSLISLTGVDNIRGSKTLTLLNLVGAALMTKEFRDGQSVELAVEALPAGTYLLQLHTEAGNAAFTILK